MSCGIRAAIACLTLIVATGALAAQGSMPADPGAITGPAEPDPGSGTPAAQHAMPPIPAIGGEIMGGGEGADLTEPGGSATESGSVPDVEYDVSKLPPAVQAIRQKILDAAKTGDPALLGPVIKANGVVPDLGDDQAKDDPIEFLKSLSGDPEGREILAILIEILDAGFVHVDAGTPDEMYVWPYFARYPIEKLTPPQIVELFKLIYAGDWEDMRNEGRYLFYRVGIDPSGRWRYFTAGD
ncbi:MAG: hypothetical protein J0H94_15620 [Rhizobiales bacterium]|nr:hypothetical protein [Hyphomicrobiales bacterium]